ncbi:hypothetical protein I553_2665 [Mycobacterium xenopi 4042]|uniref:Uncharacterized protein n=1 Tax=Mycobacterium xenopi 4042 TaxID=1299334 RepID=X8BJ22_MYCXE|nr:hypothetical protein I553_2665 [Mycobacterium xenopi 4042]
MRSELKNLGVTTFGDLASTRATCSRNADTSSWSQSQT